MGDVDPRPCARSPVVAAADALVARRPAAQPQVRHPPGGRARRPRRQRVLPRPRPDPGRRPVLGGPGRRRDRAVPAVDDGRWRARPTSALVGVHLTREPRRPRCAPSVHVDGDRRPGLRATPRAPTRAAGWLPSAPAWAHPEMTHVRPAPRPGALVPATSAPVREAARWRAVGPVRFGRPASSLVAAARLVPTVSRGARPARVPRRASPMPAAVTA